MGAPAAAASPPAPRAPTPCPQHFAKVKKNQSQQDQWRKELQKKTEGKGEVTPELLSSAMDMQLAETVALVVNR